MNRNGFTLIEVVIAMAVIAIITGTLTMALVGGVRNTATAGERTQAVRILDYLGRQASGGAGAVLATAGTPIAFGYGTLSATFADLGASTGIGDPDRYRASVTNSGTVTISSASAVSYSVLVCFQVQDGESCVQGTTLGPQPSPGGTAPPLPGVN